MKKLKIALFSVLMLTTFFLASIHNIDVAHAQDEKGSLTVSQIFQYFQFEEKIGFQINAQLTLHYPHLHGMLLILN